MDDKLAKSLYQNLRIISRSFAFLCIASPLMAQKSSTEKMKLLDALGLNNSEIADMLDTTANTVAVRLSEAKKKRSKKKNQGSKPDGED